MNKKILKIALVGKTNAGKSTLINSFVGEQISIINKKINTTQESILGIKTFNETQIIFYDTPGSNFLKTNNVLQKTLKTNLWQAIDSVNIIVYMIDALKYKYEDILQDIEKIAEVKKPIFFIFNKIDLLENKKILPFIDQLKNITLIKEFFLISAKNNIGIDPFVKFICKEAIESDWIYNNNEITNKDDIYITNECTRNAILEYLHQEIPYNISVINNNFKFLNNNQLKIKQIIQINNQRYKSIILGKKGSSIKKIRERSQSEIEKILNCKVHLYLQVMVNDKK